MKKKSILKVGKENNDHRKLKKKYINWNRPLTKYNIIKIKALKGDTNSVNSVHYNSNNNNETNEITKFKNESKKSQNPENFSFKSNQDSESNSKKNISYNPNERLEVELSSSKSKKSRINLRSNSSLSMGFSDHLSKETKTDFFLEYPGFSSYASSSFADANFSAQHKKSNKSSILNKNSVLSMNDEMMEIKWRLQLEELRREKEKELTISKFINKGEENLSSSSFVSSKHELFDEERNSNNYAKNLHRYRINIPRVQLYPAVTMLKSKRELNKLVFPSENSQRSLTTKNSSLPYHHRRVFSCMENSKKFLEKQIKQAQCEIDTSFVQTRKSENCCFEGYCMICFTENIQLECIQSSCGHKFCKNCLLFYIKDRINRQLYYTIPCPAEHCRYSIRSFFVRDFLLKFDYDNQTLFRYDRSSSWKKKLLSLVHHGKSVKKKGKIMNLKNIKV